MTETVCYFSLRQLVSNHFGSGTGKGSAQPYGIHVEAGSILHRLNCFHKDTHSPASLVS